MLISPDIGAPNQQNVSNIGNDATALWRHYDDSVDDAFLIKRQQTHVSILSVCSFAGRLLSGQYDPDCVNRNNIVLPSVAN